MGRMTAIGLAVVALAACSPPPTVMENNDAISRSLGETRAPLISGLYELTDVIAGSDGGLEPYAEEADPPDDPNVLPRPTDPSMLTLRYDPVTGSYVTQLHNIRVYDFETPFYLVEYHLSSGSVAAFLNTDAIPGTIPTFEQSTFFLVEVTSNRSFDVYLLTCESIPRNFRDANEIAAGCIFSDRLTLLRAFGQSMQLSDDFHPIFRYELRDRLPDYGDL